MIESEIMCPICKSKLTERNQKVIWDLDVSGKIINCSDCDFEYTSYWQDEDFVQSLYEGDSYVFHHNVSKPENQKRSLDNHLTPLTKNLLDNVQNPVNLVEEVSDDRWVRGGVPSRQIVKDLDYFYRSKDEQKYKDYIMGKKAYMQHVLDCDN